MSPLRLMLVAAEASGDDRGAGLMRALKRRLGPDALEFVGVGGAGMQAQGLESPFDISELSVLGIVEGLKAYPRVVRRADQVADLAVATRPDAVVLIDSWGFTLRVAQRLRRRLPGVPLIKYVGPQVWASRPGRAKTLARTVDHLLSIHAFEGPLFEAHGLPVTFVGNSTLSLDLTAADPARLRAKIGAGPDDPILVVLPGSRPGEVTRMSPPFGEAVAALRASRPKLKVVMPVASTVAGQVEAATADWTDAPILLHGEAGKLDAMRAATAALACSGTVTTQLALAGCPMVVGYRLGAMTHAILKRLIRTPYISLINIAAGEMIAPEFVQDRCTGPALAEALAPLLDDPARRQAQAAAQSRALERMGAGGSDPDEAAAEAVLRIAGRAGWPPRPAG